MSEDNKQVESNDQVAALQLEVAELREKLEKQRKQETERTSNLAEKID